LEVDAWLNRVADLIDSGVFHGSDYPREKFLKVMRGYDSRAVDRFVSALADGSVTADMLTTPSSTPTFVSKRKAQPAELVYANAAAWRYRSRRDKPFRELYLQECRADWARFPDLPGAHLRLIKGQIGDRNGQPLMTGRAGRLTDVASGRAFRIAGTRTGNEVLDELTGEMIIRWSGRRQAHEAETTVSRGDQPWLWFPVRGTSAKDAVMHAIDASGTKILSFRQLGRHDIEVVARPDLPVTPEILCVIFIAGPRLVSFFESPGGG